ncbi:MAG: sigma-70 family RNA polymerase sigma factor [Planctomycetales bacterium]|nr:sigma-70 family RNA polymerase sigma factor [Planctomycetales bacterium]
MWPTDEKTEQLLDGVRTGDDGAANRLLERHRDSLRRMIEMRLDRRIQQRVDASDIVQEVMIEANRRLQKYLDDPVMPFHLWIRQMARDRIIDAHRRHRGSGKRSVDREKAMTAPGAVDRSTIELAAQLCDAEMTPAEAATMRELHQRFQNAIEELDENDREIVIMRHVEQLSNQDVATALGLTAPAASMRYLRAIRRLRSLLNISSDEAGGE